jgi:[ribosomal protein S5]-alanine N-acetyltransferase
VGVRLIYQPGLEQSSRQLAVAIYEPDPYVATCGDPCLVGVFYTGAMIEIEARTFKLRPFHKGDEVAITTYANNPEIYRTTLALPFPYLEKDALEWIVQNQAEQRRRHPGMVSFAIDIDGDAIGCVGLSDIEIHKAEVGYWLGEPFWGRGIATQALKLTTRYAFSELGLRRVFAQVFTFNEASVRVLEKAAYKYEGLLRKNEFKDGKLLDTMIYAKVR